jgi:hypothetical protein
MIPVGFRIILMHMHEILSFLWSPVLMKRSGANVEAFSFFAIVGHGNIRSQAYSLVFLVKEENIHFCCSIVKSPMPLLEDLNMAAAMDIWQS